jgi:large subunit ribosomal protein L3
MGDVRKTVQNLLVMGIRPERNLILVKGSIPGCKNSVVIIRQAIKMDG